MKRKEMCGWMCLVLLACAVGWAQDTLSAKQSAGRYGAAQDALATKRVLQGTYNNNGAYSGSFPVNVFAPVDTLLTVACPGTGTCTIQADMWVENGGETLSGDANVICLYVDGIPAGSCGAVTGETPPDGSYVQNSTSQAVTNLTHGNHTVQTWFITVKGAQVGYYNANYRVYRP